MGFSFNMMHLRAIIILSGLIISMMIAPGCQPTVDIELLDAAEAGRQDVVEEALDLGANVNAERTETGETSLILAARHGHDHLVKFFLGKGVKIDQRRKDGSTALMLAVIGKRSEVVDILIANGADVNIPATQFGYRNITPLHCWVINEGRWNIGESLVRGGGHLNAKTSSGLSPLDLAHSAKNVERAKWLTKHGAH